VLAFVAVASRPAFAQPHPGGWKTALSAALAFGHAEGKAAALASFRIAAPTTKKGQATGSWERAVADDTSAYWTARARDRVAGGVVPGC